MLRQIERWVKNEPIIGNSVSPETTLFFLQISVSVGEPLMRGWFDVPATQMPIFVLSLSVRVLFDGASPREYP